LRNVECRSFSARACPTRPLSRTPLGAPRSTRKNKNGTDAASILVKRHFKICDAVAVAGYLFGTEHPEDRGFDPFPSIFATEEFKTLEAKHACSTISGDQCRFGSLTKKPTTISANVNVTSLRHRCDHSPGSHNILRGKGQHGFFKTSSAQEYPIRYCEAIALCFVEHLIRFDLPSTKDIDGDFLHGAPGVSRTTPDINIKKCDRDISNILCDWP
jgi:hypothetical protein